MLDYILQHKVEVAPFGPSASSKFYLPHHAVKKEKRKVVKWRIVFDASSHEPGSPSLNDSLEMGPNLLPEILSVLLFRLYKCAILGDVRQDSLQIILEPTGRDLTRILWYRVVPNSQGSYDNTDEVITYRFIRLPLMLAFTPFSFQLPSARWPRYITTCTLLHAPLWTGAPIWMISQHPQHMATISSLSSSKLCRS